MVSDAVGGQVNFVPPVAEGGWIIGRASAGEFVQHLKVARSVTSANDTAALSLASVPRQYRAVSANLAIAPSVSVIIPALNESLNLPHVLPTLPRWVDEVVLVDGRSTDDTTSVAERLLPGIKIVTQQGRGKGDALMTGFAACSGNIIVTMDADGSTHGGEIIRFVSALLAGADFAKGSRFANGGGSSDITAARRYGNRILSGLVNRLFGTRYTDLCYGYNAFWAEHLDTLRLDCAGFEVEAMMNVRAAAAGLRIQEVPSFEYPRLHGVSNLKIVSDGWRIARVIAREWSRVRSARESRSRTAARPTVIAETLSPPSPALDLASRFPAGVDRI
jgi:glycosyltransferase involved in cell wall biosynthesis